MFWRPKSSGYYSLLVLLPAVFHAETAESALWNAIEINNVTGAQEALRVGAEPAESSRAFLAFAASKGNPEIVRALLQAKARMDVAGLDIGPPLTAAIWRSNETPDRVEIVRDLLAAGAINATADLGAAAVGQAFSSGCFAIGAMLVAAGAAVETADQSAPSILHTVLARPVVAEDELIPTVKTLLSAGADPKRKDKQGRTVADLAAEYGLLQTQALLEPDKPTERDLAAIRQRGLDRQLLGAIARHDSSRRRWVTPPPYQPGPQLLTIKALLKAGANPRVSLRLWGEWDRTALGVLLDSSTAPPYEADPEVLDLLLAHGAKWEDLGRNQNRRIREILSLPGLGEVAVRHGLRGDALIPAFAFSSRGEGKETSSTLLHAAAEGGVVKVVEALVKAGGQINGADGAGYTPLARAVAAGREEVTEFLIKRGAKIDVVTTDGLSLVDLAAQANNRRRIKLWDKSDRYRELLDSFSPPSNSKWTGKWMMGDPKYPSVVTLEKDGSGYSGFGWLMWTETDEGIRLRMTRTNRLGLPAGTVELDLESDQLGGLRRKQQGAEGQWHLWRPQHPPQPDSEKALANAMERQKLQAKIDEQFAALASGRSDGFWLDSSTPPSGLPEQVWTETRWARFSVHGGELGTLPRAMSGMSRLKHLEISNQKRLRIEPGALALPALEMLDLRSTGLEELPVDWSLLPQLQQVTIFDSRLSALPGGWRNARNLIWFGVGDSRLRTLPDDLGEAPVLKRLGASGQQLRELPASLANSVVEELYLDSNRFERMPTCVRSMRTLRSLSFGQNRLVSVGAEELPSGLHSLGLAGNRLRRVPDLSTLQQLEKLDLSSNAIEELPDDPGWLPSSVIELNLRGNPIKTIPDWLRTRAFRRLDLGQNAWPEEQAREIAKQAETRWREKAKK